MSRVSWQVRIGIILLLCSISIYSLKFVLLGDPENTCYYIFNALGFLPINVLLVTLILNELLSVRARKDRMEKMNMVIGTFFSEMGTDLLASVSRADRNLRTLEPVLRVTGDWQDTDFRSVGDILVRHPFEIDAHLVDLEAMRTFLRGHRNFLMRLLENPVLLEHQTFTELLRAVFHLAEELERRDGFSCLPETDCSHLAGDIQRVYRTLALEWLAYMAHLKKSYPYLFSLAMRTNPFDAEASVVVGS